MYKLSTTCFCKGSFGLGNIWMISPVSMIFKGFCDLKMVNWSVHWILFTGFVVLRLSMYRSSTSCFWRGSFCVGNISKKSFISIIFSGLAVFNIVNLSIF